MTIPSQIRRAGPFVGNSSTTVFPFAFKVFAAEDVQVYLLDQTADEFNETPLVQGVDYSIQVNPDQENNPGGDITYPLGGGAVLAPNQKLTAIGDLSYEQPTAITNQGGFYPRVIEDALDRATIQIQQLAEQVSRAILAPISGGVSGEELTQQLAEQLPYVAALYQYLDQINGVYSNLDEINTVDSLQGEIHALAQIRSAIETLASIESELQALVPALPLLENDIAPHVQDIHIVADDLNASWQSGVQYDFGLIIDEPSGPGVPPEGYIATVANNIDHIIAVEGDIGYVKNVSDNMPQVLDVSTNITSVISVSGNLQNIQDILDIEGKIDSVIANEQNIVAVADNETNINAAVANESNINAVVANEQNITAVAENEDMVEAVGRDLNGQPIVLDYGDLSPAENPATPSGVLGAVWTNSANIAAVGGEIAAVVYVSQHLQAILDALAGALITTNNLSDLTDPAAARANLGLADLGTLT